MALFANLITYPPLAQVSVVPPSRNEFNFTVVLESSQSLPERPWEVSIWYDDASYSAHKTTTWQALELDLVNEAPYPLTKDDGGSSPVLRRYTYTGNLASPFVSHDKVHKGRRVPFTVRYRIDQHSQWQWVYHNFGIADGELILQPPIDPNYLSSSPVDLKTGWWSRKLPSEASGARLYVMESTEPIHSPPPGSGQDAQAERRVFGRVLSVSRWLALVRIWSPWLAPRHGDYKLHLSEPAILLSFLRSDGLHVLVLAVNGIDDVVTTFSSSDDGEIVIEARNDSGKDRKFKVLAASAWRFEVALAAAMYEMRKLVRSSAVHQEMIEKIPKHIRAESLPSEPDTVMVSSDAALGASSPPNAPHANWLEFWYDALAFCTWNSLGQDLNLDKIVNAIQSLADNDIHIGSLIIDDNWQSLSGKQGDDQFTRTWQDFEANPDGFPHGLKAATTLIREKFPAIKDISVWHALMGYWGGIDPNGKIAKNYKTRDIRTSNTAQHMTPLQQITPSQPVTTPQITSSLTVIDPADIGRMYNDFYQYLSDSGVTGVKTDAQFMLDELASTLDRREFTNTYLSAWTQAHLTHLSGKAISCMSCIPQILYGSLLPIATPRIILRNSDDFFPDIAESHPWHVFANAHNALFTQHLNALPDWDMFQTSHPYSSYHAAARCLSGGPIYITDEPGKHDFDLIHQITALNPRRQTVILRPSTVGKAMGVYDKYDEKGVLKIGAYDGRADTGTGFLGVFNLDAKEISFLLPITKFPGVDVQCEGAVQMHSQTTSQAESRMPSCEASRRGSEHEHIDRVEILSLDDTTTEPEMLLHGKLAVRGYDVWSALPVHEVTLKGNQKETHRSVIELAVLGLLGKMVGAAAIIGSHSESWGHRVRCHVQLKALGTLGIWLRRVSGHGDEKDKWNQDDMMVLIQGMPLPADKLTVTKNAGGGDDGFIIEIDILSAWKEMDLSPGLDGLAPRPERDHSGGWRRTAVPPLPPLPSGGVHAASTVVRVSVCTWVGMPIDTEFNSTARGSRLRSCVGCLLNSTVVDTASNETDVEFGLLALRFTLSSCMFGIPDERVSLSSPCQVTCTPLNASIGYNLTRTPAYTDARLDFCTASIFDDTTINNCAFCYSMISQQLFVANFLQALHIACRDPPTPGQPFFPNAAAIFNETLIAGPAPPSKGTGHHGLRGTALAIAIALPIVGGILLISSVCWCCFISARRRRRQMAASGRMERVHEHEARIHSPIDAKPMWGDQEPPREMTQLTPTSATASARWSLHYNHQQQQQPGIALGGHESDGTPLRDSFHQRDDVGPGLGQVRDPNLHELYFGVDDEEEDSDDPHNRVAIAAAGVDYIAGPSSSTPTAHALSLYDQIRAEHASNPSLQYQQQHHHHDALDGQRGPWT
ncbi:hypothetical protein DV736_g4240, partial [Chaetothyriales sp. CBS 134916]